MMSCARSARRLGAAVALMVGLAFPCQALQLEPRRWSHLPVGSNTVGFGGAYSAADIELDPALQLENVEMKRRGWAVKYLRSLALFGRSARVDLKQAYAEARWTGLLEGEPASTTRSGLADTVLRFSALLYGAPPLKIGEYRRYRSTLRTETVVGLGVAVTLPTGQYYNDRLVNLGGNRFVYRPQLGFTHRRGKWTIEGTAEVAIHSDNDDFFDGDVLEQAPLHIAHLHLIYSFRPGLWLSASAGGSAGGETSVNGQNNGDRQKNAGWALSLSYPIRPGLGFSLAYIHRETLVSTGLDADNVAAGLFFFW